MKTTSVISFFLATVGLGCGAEEERPVVPEQLYAGIRVADRIVVRENPSKDAVVLYTTTNPKDIAALVTALTIEVPGQMFFCMCIGSPQVVAYNGEKETASFTNHHGDSIRTDLWTSHARLVDSERLLKWFEDRGITGPREEVDEMREDARRSDEAASRWEEQMPSSIRPLWRNLDGFKPDISIPSSALEKEIPDKNIRILSLYSWFGSGSGLWSGFPLYECLAEEMLLAYSTQELLTAIEGRELTEAQKEGVARLFAGWDFSQRRKGEITLLSDSLCADLLAHSIKSLNEDKVGRARHAFTRKK